MSKRYQESSIVHKKGVNMKHSNYLQKIIEHKQSELPINQKITMPIREQLKQRKFSDALSQPGVIIIAEIKRRSPSLGEIAVINDPVALTSSYCKGGASAISVLTDSHSFGGSLNDLTEVSAFVAKEHPSVPTLRKDFIIHPLQLIESIQAGASAVLLIACVLKGKLQTFIEESEKLGLEALVEVHDEADLELAIASGASIIGVNNRDLTSFKVDLNVSERLRPRIPAHILTVCESGIHTVEDAKRMHGLGFHGLLIGQALVTSNDPSKTIKIMKENTHES